MPAASTIGYVARTPAAKWVLDYAGTAFHGSLLGTVLEVTFTDNLGALSGEVELKLEDHGKDWQGALFPIFGDNLFLQVGYADEIATQLPAGFFQVDTIHLSGPPDVIAIHAMPTPVNVALRTRNTVGYEKQTLLGVANIIAKKHGFAVVGLPTAIDVQFARLTQYRETDLGFLRRLALDHGYDFKIQNAPVPAPTTAPPPTLVFYSLAKLDSNPPVGTIRRTDCVRFEFDSHTHLVYAACEASYFDPATKALITYHAADNTAPATVTDVLKINDRCENQAVAQMKATAALAGANILAATGKVTLEGTTQYVPGNTCDVRGFGKYEGRYRIQTAKHTLSRAKGYLVELDLLQIPLPTSTGATTPI